MYGDAGISYGQGIHVWRVQLQMQPIQETREANNKQLVKKFGCQPLPQAVNN
jgi:hypothetical protein